MTKFYTFVGRQDDEVLHVYYDEDGVRHEDQITFKPLLGKVVEGKPGKTYKYRDIYGNPVQWKRFDSISKYRNFIDEYEEIDFLGNMKEEYQFLSEEYPDAIDYDLSKVRPFLIDIEIDNRGKGSMEEIMENANAEVTSIAIKCIRSGRYFVMATKPWSPDESVFKDPSFELDLKKVRFKQCDSEEALFKHLRKTIRREKPDMLIGFYSKMFDFPYLIKRGRYILGKEFMNGFSPWGFTTCKKKTDNLTGKVYDYFNQILGLPLLDFRLMYKKFVYTPRESYSLDYLAQAELGDTKLDYSEYDSLSDMWDSNPQKYIDYNIWDVELMDLMDKKLGLIDLSMTIAYYAKTNFEDTLGTVGIWDSIFYNTLKKQDVMIPAKHVQDKERYAGAYVFEPKKEIHDWIISVDLKSLYPHVQQQYNISPESIIDDLRYDDVDIESDLDDRYLNEEMTGPEEYIMAANGCFFRKDKEGIVPGLLREIYDNRVVAKKEMNEKRQELQEWKNKHGIDVKTDFDKYDGPEELKKQWAEFDRVITTKNNYQMAMKILMNSEYGALANVHFRYYDIRLASAITLCAQLALKWAAKRILESPARKKYRYDLIYGDTDSLYISVKYVADQIKLRKPDISDTALVKQINAFVAKIIQPILSEGYEDLARYMNANENRMFMNHEKTMSNAMWTSKKRYALNVLWDEGVTYPKPKLKVKGIEIVRSSTPKVIREKLKEAVALMLSDESKLIDFVNDQKKKFMDRDPLDVAFPRGVNNLDKFLVENADGSFGYAPKTPIGVRAAIVYNNLVKDKEGWPMIQSGEKIKFIFLKKPNIFSENVIGFMRRIPEEAIPYIDWDMQFNKSFLSVIENIYRKMGKEFKTYREVNLSDIF